MSVADSIGDRPLIASLVDTIVRRHPLHKSFIERSLAFLEPPELGRLEQILGYLTGKGHQLDYIVDCYLTVVEDTTNEQMYFFRHGKYRCETYREVAERVYHNRGYMDRYMYGLVLTAFLWPNHVEITRFFERVLPADRTGHYLEVGPGHGYYLAQAAASGGFDELVGIDISEASIAQTGAFLGHFSPQSAGRCQLILGDFLATGDLEPGSFDAAVMGEVLEHVEQPEAFLRRLRELVRDDAFVYVTTCVNAPAIDHIYLWRSTDEVEAMIVDCGFTIGEALRLPYEGKTLEQSQRQQLPINVAYVLHKAAP